jgi:hypothetical protein
LDIDKKIKMYNLMQSQVRAFRNNNMLQTLAELRGIQANVKYAEAFEVLRWIE